jgi:hypothetical protein
MSSFNDALEGDLLDVLFGITASYTAPPIHLALYTVNPTDAGGDGTEVAVGGYTRGGNITGAANWTRATSTVTNDNNEDFPVATSPGYTVTGMAALNHASASLAANFLFWDDVGSVVIGIGDTPRFTASTGITVTLA